MSRKRILKAYLELSYENGLEAPTLQQLAKKSGLSYFAIHYHFGKNRHNLLIDGSSYVSQRAQEWIGSYLAKNRSDRTPLENYIYGTFHWASQQKIESTFWAQQYSLAMARKPLQEIHNSVVAEARQRIRSLLEIGINSGSLPSLYDLSGLSLKIHSIIVGFVLLSSVEGLQGAQLGKRVKACLDSVFLLIQTHRIHED